MTITFTGTVSGTPGTRFTLSFNRFDEDVQQIAGNTAQTIPANGQVAVSDTMTFAASTTAGRRNFDQIFAHNIAGQADVYSGAANVTVNCAGGHAPLLQDSTRLRISPGMSILSPAYPNRLHQTTVAQECGSHIGNPFAAAAVCDSALRNGRAIFVWDWNPNCPTPNICVKDINGYRLYRVDGGRHDLAYDQNNGSGVTAIVLPPPAGGYDGKCYAVTAYKGARESYDSNTVCVGVADLGGKHFTLFESANTMGTGSNTVMGGNLPGNNCLIGYPDVPSDTVGFFHQDGCAVGSFWYRHYVRFDTSRVAGRLIKKATLHFHIAWSRLHQSGMHQDVTNNINCADGVYEADEPWGDIDKDHLVGGPRIASMATEVSVSPDISIDVTPTVQRWASGASPNYGIMLKGTNESPAEDNNKCMTGYQQFAISVDGF